MRINLFMSKKNYGGVSSFQDPIRDASFDGPFNHPRLVFRTGNGQHALPLLLIRTKNSVELCFFFFSDTPTPYSSVFQVRYKTGTERRTGSDTSGATSSSGEAHSFKAAYAISPGFSLTIHGPGDKPCARTCNAE